MSDIHDEIKRLEAKVTCKICGGILEKSPSGAVCENLHGKIVNRPDPKDVKRYRKLKAIAELPEAKPFYGFKTYFRVPDLDGRLPYWEKVSECARGSVPVRYGFKKIWVDQVRSDRVDAHLRKLKAK
jgi:hypothetical protein